MCSSTPYVRGSHFLVHRIIRGPIANIYVGRRKVRFILPKNVACRQCFFFKEKFSEHLEDAQDTAMNLSEIDPETFARFAQWIYQEKLPPATIDDNDETYVSFHSLLELYHLASRLKAPKLQNEIMAQLRILYCSMRDEYPMDAFTIFEVYRGTEDNSALRRFVCDAAAKEFLDRDKGKGQSYRLCFSTLSAFAEQFAEALYDYHSFSESFIMDCPEQYTVDTEGAN